MRLAWKREMSNPFAGWTNKMILAIDPGTDKSAWLIFDGQGVVSWGFDDNKTLLGKLDEVIERDAHELVIEQVASYGMPVGKEVFETVFWSGRFAQAWGREFHRMTRVAVKTHLCHSAMAKDGNVRQALLDRFGPKGTKKNPGKLYGLKSHAFAALALAVAFSEQNQQLMQPSTDPKAKEPEGISPALF